jgi:hypothetical protein
MNKELGGRQRDARSVLVALVMFLTLSLIAAMLVSGSRVWRRSTTRR